MQSGVIIMSCLLVELIEMHKVDLATAISTYFFVLILDLFYQNLILSAHHSL